MSEKKDQPKPAEGKPRAALETASGGVTVVGPERMVNINISAGIYSAEDLRDLIIPELVEAFADAKLSNEGPTDVN